jgi:hypothetical protein
VTDLLSGISGMQTHARTIQGIPMTKLVFIRKEAKKKFFVVSRSKNRYALYAEGICTWIALRLVLERRGGSLTEVT